MLLDRFRQGLNNPLTIFGLSTLANNGNVGQGGIAALGLLRQQQQDKQRQDDNALRRQLLQQQIENSKAAEVRRQAAEDAKNNFTSVTLPNLLQDSRAPLLPGEANNNPITPGFADGPIRPGENQPRLLSDRINRGKLKQGLLTSGYAPAVNSVLPSLLEAPSLTPYETARQKALGEALLPPNATPEQINRAIPPKLTPYQQEVQKLKAQNQLPENASIDELARSVKEIKDPFEKFSYEEKLRKEYSTKSTNYNEAVRNYSNIETSAKDSSGAGDIALITSFMKMLDPGSVVRETEFAAGRDTAGLLASLRGSITKIEDGKFLGTEQRQKFVNLAKKYLDAAKKQRGRLTQSVRSAANNYGLNLRNIIGIDAHPQKNTQGWTLQQDANGNYAYVSPDGEQFEEIQ